MKVTRPRVMVHAAKICMQWGGSQETKERFRKKQDWAGEVEVQIY